MAFDVRAPESLAWIASLSLAYPALESLHLLDVALLIGNQVSLEMRVWGRAMELPVAALARLSLSLALAGFALAALTGALMFAQPAG